MNREREGERPMRVGRERETGTVATDLRVGAWLQVRVHAEEKAEWVATAKARGMSLSEWVRKTLTSAAERQLHPRGL